MSALAWPHRRDIRRCALVSIWMAASTTLLMLIGGPPTHPWFPASAFLAVGLWYLVVFPARRARTTAAAIAAAYTADMAEELRLAALPGWVAAGDLPPAEREAVDQEFREIVAEAAAAARIADRLDRRTEWWDPDPGYDEIRF